MSFEEDDEVVLSDKHSEFDGETGTVTQVVETMFGEPNYTVSFEEGQEAGVPADNLEAAEGGEGRSPSGNRTESDDGDDGADEEDEE